MNQGMDVKMNPLECELERNVDEKLMEAAKLKKLGKSSNLEKWVERKKTSMMENTISALDETNNGEQVRGTNFEANTDMNKHMEGNTDCQCPICDKRSFSSPCRLKSTSPLCTCAKISLISTLRNQVSVMTVERSFIFKTT